MSQITATDFLKFKQAEEVKLKREIDASANSFSDKQEYFNYCRKRNAEFQKEMEEIQKLLNKKTSDEIKSFEEEVFELEEDDEINLEEKTKKIGPFPGHMKWIIIESMSSEVPGIEEYNDLLDEISDIKVEISEMKQEVGRCHLKNSNPKIIQSL